MTAYFKKFPFQLPQSGVGIMDGVDEGEKLTRLKAKYDKIMKINPCKIIEIYVKII